MALWREVRNQLIDHKIPLSVTLVIITSRFLSDKVICEIDQLILSQQKLGIFVFVGTGVVRSILDHR